MFNVSLRRRDGQGAARGDGPPHRGGGDGPRRERVDDVPQDHAAADRCPGVAAAGLLAFALSIDDFVITNFNAGQTVTFPLYIYGASRQGVPPQVNVLATMLLLVVLVLMLAEPARSSGGARRDARVPAPPGAPVSA